MRLKQDWEQRVMKVKRFELECSRLGKPPPQSARVLGAVGKNAVAVPIIPAAVDQVEAEVWPSGNLAWSSSSSSSAALHQEAISSR